MRDAAEIIGSFAFGFRSGGWPRLCLASVAVDINGAPYTGPSNPKGVKLVANEPFSVDITIKGGKPADPIWLKHGGDVQMNGASNDTKPDSDAYTFYLVPMRAGPLTLPGMDIPIAGQQHITRGSPSKLVVSIPNIGSRP